MAQLGISRCGAPCRARRWWRTMPGAGSGGRSTPGGRWSGSPTLPAPSSSACSRLWPSSACGTSANFSISNIRPAPMTRSRKRLVTFIGALLGTAGLIVAACFAVNCLVDPLWYLRGNVLTEINYPFNERLSKLVRFLPRMADYDCVIFGTSRATLLPEEKAKGYRCFNMAVSGGQASEYLLYADYLRQRRVAPRLI